MGVFEACIDYNGRQFTIDTRESVRVYYYYYIPTCVVLTSILQASGIYSTQLRSPRDGRAPTLFSRSSRLI